MGSKSLIFRTFDGQAVNFAGVAQDVRNNFENSDRGIEPAPRVIRCCDSTWQSSSVKSLCDRIWHRKNIANFDALSRLLNIDSPKKTRPILSP